jgi:steroid 5-alpha reductase family enzyme
VEPLALVFLVAAIVTGVCWLLSVITRETSWVDRIWSIAPVVYVWIFAADALAAGVPATRLVVMAVLATAWGARLTFNFARKGGYSGMEDYRWAILRKRMAPWQFQLFNLGFISLYQNALLVLITLPAYTAWRYPAPLTGADAAILVGLTALFVAFLVGELMADQQQWDFHQAKRRAGGTLAPGFATAGLFRYSRHPNFFFEQAQWWVFYALGATAAAAAGAPAWGGLANWTIAGAALLSILFIGSTIFTESITASRYPAYAEYQRTTSMIVPWPPRR